MLSLLEQDSNQIDRLLKKVADYSVSFLNRINEIPPVTLPKEFPAASLPDSGVGAEAALEEFDRKFGPHIAAGAGPRYFGLVIGGATPASLAGDWLTSVFDQNATGHQTTATAIEQETVALMRSLFGLSDEHSGAFVTGTTMANFVGLALARQWLGVQAGINVANEGIQSLPPILVLSGAPHSSIYKSLSMLGIGKGSMRLLPCLPGRQAIDVVALEKALRACGGQPCIVVANAGDVNTVDFDDLAAIGQLKRDFNFWMHVDGAFGAFAACSPKYRHLTDGLDAADSIAVDGHKWMNVPYDSALQFTRHPKLQFEVFQSSAPYLNVPGDSPRYHQLTPESSRRLRALAAWFSLIAYGREGHCEIVERNCELAASLGTLIEQSDQFRLLAPVRMNVVCFTLAGSRTEAEIQEFMDILRNQGQVALGPTVYDNTPGLRAALANWRTTEADIEITWNCLREAATLLEQKSNAAVYAGKEGI